MMGFGIRLVSDAPPLVQSVAGRAIEGSVVALRPVLRGLRTWELDPRRMAIIALDSGKWCFAWIAGEQGSCGARVRFLARAAGEKYPTFTLVHAAVQQLSAAAPATEERPGAPDPA